MESKINFRRKVFLRKRRNEEKRKKFVDRAEIIKFFVELFYNNAKKTSLLALSDFLSPSEILSLYRKKVIASIFPGSMRNVKRFLIATGPTDGPVIR